MPLATTSEVLVAVVTLVILRIATDVTVAFRMFPVDSVVPLRSHEDNMEEAHRLDGKVPLSAGFAVSASV